MRKVGPIQFWKGCVINWIFFLPTFFSGCICVRGLSYFNNAWGLTYPNWFKCMLSCISVRGLVYHNKAKRMWYCIGVRALSYLNNASSLVGSISVRGLAYLSMPEVWLLVSLTEIWHILIVLKFRQVVSLPENGQIWSVSEVWPILIVPEVWQVVSSKRSDRFYQYERPGRLY